MLDFSATGVLALESARGEGPVATEAPGDSKAYLLASPPLRSERVEDPFVDDDADDAEPAWIVEPSEVPLVTVDPIIIETVVVEKVVVETVAVETVAVESEPVESEPVGAQSGPPAVLRIAAAIVTDQKGRCLLVRKAGSTAFMQAGGKLESGESALDALTRELHEELGLELDEATAEYLGVFRAEAANEAHTLISAAVFAVQTAAQIEPRGEIEQLLWIDRLDDITVELAPLTRDELLPLWASRRAGATLF
ncbi:MAG TPA: NUDIX domain-containing protein [Pseudolysinimonas sp.]